MMMNTTVQLELEPLPPGLDLEAGVKHGEDHPSARLAVDWLQSVPLAVICNLRRVLAMEAHDHHESSRVCLTTLQRLLTGQQVSDRYLMGLAWELRTRIENMTETS